jgi:hypothetical protein
MRQEWLEQCIRLSYKKADFFSGARKVIRNVHFTFEDIQPDLIYSDAGYAKNKRGALNKLYKHEESLTKAVELWELRKKKAKYGSVSFHCYNHLLKADPEKGSKRASVMGPCLQSVCITWISKKDGCAIDVFYRTTELFKKFPADLIFLRDDLLSRFNFDGCPIKEINFHFANVTCHPMYFIVPAIQMKKNGVDPFEALDQIKRKDANYWLWIIKWTARYLCDEHKRGIQKYAQAMRVHDEARKALTPKELAEWQKYLRANHPGFAKDYVDPDGEDDE